MVLFIKTTPPRVQARSNNCFQAKIQLVAIGFQPYFVGKGLQESLSSSKQEQPLQGLQSGLFANPKIGSYLAGLWEGDGHIILPKYNKVCKLINTPCFAITFGDKQLPLVEKLVKIYGGWIRHKTKQKAIVWTIQKKLDLLNIVKILNGHLRSPKIYEFNQLINYLEVLFNTNLFRQSISNIPLADNYWLAGFVDADGGFKIRYTFKRINEITGKVLSKQRIEVRFVIEQRQTHPKNQEPYLFMMKQIAEFLSVNLNLSKHNTKHYWIVEVASLAKLQILINYLNTYPLFTTKHNDYKDWLKAFALVKQNKHLTELSKSQIFAIKSNMNRKRTLFDWSHIQ